MNNYMFGDKKNKIKDTERSLISETVRIEGTINKKIHPIKPNSSENKVNIKSVCFSGK